MPGGYHAIGGEFNGLGASGDWWTATESNAFYVCLRLMGSGYTYVGKFNYGSEVDGFSVRCLRD